MNTLANNRSHIMLVKHTPQKLKHSESILGGEENCLISTFLDGSMDLKVTAKRPPDLSNFSHETILAFSKLAEVRDDETGRHVERTRVFCRLLTDQIRIQCPGKTEIDKAFIDNIYVASLLHDIGKVAISDEILLKPGKLTAEEFEIMKTHTVVGAKILQTMLETNIEDAFSRMAIEITLSHHEKWDGSGYPQNLKGKSIPLSARIMALADVYDALTSERHYKPVFSHQKSRDIILIGRGTHFDPEVIDAFLVLEDQFRNIKHDLK